jgi:succinate dehydrogenase/fumarate reductase cytochrome b subunit
MMKKLHYLSGITITVFVAVHLLNHLMLFKSEQAHINLMETARLFYRNPIMETILLMAVIIQVVSGITLVKKKWNMQTGIFERLQIYSGLFLSYFLIAHVSAVMIGRYLLKLDTNLYFGAAVLNNYPACLYFILHYGLAVIAIFTHLGCIHKIKISAYTTEVRARSQAYSIMGAGVIISMLIVYRMMDVAIPIEYRFLPFGEY